MRIEIDDHALKRAEIRGTSAEQIKATIEFGEEYPAKEGRVSFRRNFCYDAMHNGKHYENIQVIVIAQEMSYGWLAITVITKFF